jgi:AMP nucleosidase
MATHLNIALDAVANLKARWPDVERQLHSEW